MKCPGEVALEKQAHVHEPVMSYAPTVIRPYMPEQNPEYAHRRVGCLGCDSVGDAAQGLGIDSRSRSERTTRTQVNPCFFGSLDDLCVLGTGRRANPHS